MMFRTAKSTNTSQPLSKEAQLKGQSKAIHEFYQIALIYLVSFAVWLGLWRANNWPDGVDSGVLVFIVFSHILMMAIHAKGIFYPVNAQPTTSRSLDVQSKQVGR